MKSQTIAAVAIFAVALLLIGCTRPGGVVLPGVPNPPAGESGGLKSFSSWDEVSAFLQASGSGGYGSYGRGGIMDVAFGMPAPMMAKATSEANAGAGQSASDYSATNVQVEGVDEADIVKNDGKYIYAVQQPGNYYYGQGSQSKIKIVDAYPPAIMRMASEITVEGGVSEIFVYKDKLVAFGSDYRAEYAPEAQPKIACMGCIMPPRYSSQFAFMKVYDISDREKPALEKSYEVKGNYLQSRMIGGKVYAIFQDYPDWRYPMPLYTVDGVAAEVQPSEVKYFDWPDGNYNFNTFLGIDLDNIAKAESRKIVLMGYSQNIYVSQGNMYVTYARYESYPVLYQPYGEAYGPVYDKETRQKIAEIDASNKSAWMKERLKVGAAEAFLQRTLYNQSSSVFDQATGVLLRQSFNDKVQKVRERPWQENERTVINKIALDGAFTYVAKGEVPGHALNQFSMDESGGYFRIATTVGQVGGWMMQAEAASSNNVYVLNEALDIVGRLEGLARGEKIYSSRFMGNRLYLVTFKKVDPFFVIDLADPKSPKMLGKLKIPGYSDYLHPYDETHVIGLGKGAVAAEEGDFAWYQGVKLSLFDVSDVAHPTEAAKYEIGDRGTDSYALSDHKAFLFSKSKNLMVIPITLAEVPPTTGKQDPQAYGNFVFQGAYVFSVTPESGFVLRGRISHADQEELAKSGEYYWSDSNVKRSLYMGDYLYTVSGKFVNANDLGTLLPISSVQFSNGTDYGYGPTYYQ